jgi:hypothetical protein
MVTVKVRVLRLVEVEKIKGVKRAENLGNQRNVQV